MITLFKPFSLMAVEIVKLPLEYGFSLNSAHITPNGEIIAVINNYWSSSLNWTNGSAPETKILKFNKARQLIWSHVFNSVFQDSLLEVGVGGQFVFVGTKPGLRVITKQGQDHIDQTVYTFSKDGLLLDQIAIEGNGSEKILDLQISDAGIAWITFLTDSSVVMGSSNYNKSSPIDPFGPGKPDNTLGNDVLVLRADAIRGGSSIYRVGTELADISNGGKIMEVDGSFLLGISSPKTVTPKVNGSVINFEEPFSSNLFGKNLYEYFVPLSQSGDAKAFNSPTYSQILRRIELIDPGFEMFLDTSSNVRKYVHTKIDDYNSLYVDEWESYMQRTSTAIKNLPFEQISKYDTFNYIPYQQKIILKDTEYEMIKDPKISVDSSGGILLVTQLKKDSDTIAKAMGNWVFDSERKNPYGDLTILLATFGLSVNNKVVFPVVELTTGTTITSLLNSVPEAIGLVAGQPKDIAPSDSVSISINAPGWRETINLIRICQAAETGSRLQTRQPEEGLTTKLGSLIVGGAGNDVITGGRGWDIVDGGGGDDLIKTGNGRDILQGGLGSDELWGGFGWNTYRSEQDGFADRLVIRSDQLLSNQLNGKAGNNPDGSKADVIEGLDNNDQIVIQGANSTEIRVQAGAIANGLNGIGIYAQGFLEALYIGNNLNVADLQLMVSGDTSTGAINNTIFSYNNVWK